jgi:hypothetical protein
MSWTEDEGMIIYGICFVIPGLSTLLIYVSIVLILIDSLEEN